MTTASDIALKLSRKLDEGNLLLDTFDLYFEGKAPLSFLAPELAEATNNRLRPLTVPYPRVVVDSISERLNITGFRVGGIVDPALWQTWQANNLDEFSLQAHDDALIHGRSYVMTWVDDQGEPRIIVESAKQCWVQFIPGTRIRQYGIRRFRDEDDHGRLDLFTANEIIRFRSAGTVTDDSLLFNSNFGEPFAVIPNPLGVVPLIPLVNKPRILQPYGTSELADLLPLFDAINKLFTDTMVSSEFNAMPRRWATGITIPEARDETTGRVTGNVDAAEAFDPVAGRIWLSESESTRFGEFAGSSLAGFTNGITTLIETLAAAASLPSHYLGITTANPASADAIRSSEAALVAKVRKRQRSFESAWEESMRLAVAISTGSFDPNLDGLEVIWADPESRTVAQTADAALKLVAGDILTADSALEMIGFTPTQIEQVRVQRRTATVDAAAASLLDDTA